MNNLTEIVRGGEMQRSIEQSTLWDGPAHGATVGFARGMTRTLTRTGIGLYEVITAPIPPYRPLLVQKGPFYPDASVATRKSPWGGLELSEKPVFPAAYTPGLPGYGLFDTDRRLGMSGGEVAPGFLGSRFTVLDP